MDDSAKPSFGFTAGAFALALAAGLAAAAASLADMREADWARLAEPARLSSGESARAVTRVVNDQFVARGAFFHIERAIAWLALRDWGPRVREGCPGWLFLADELESHPGAPESAALRASLAERLQARLAGKGIALVVAVVPDKSRIEAARLCGLERAPRTEGRVADWVERLRAGGVTVVDLTEVLARMPGERYYRSDTHWNERGAEEAAQAIAAALRARGLAPVQTTRPTPLAPRTVDRSGDLVRVAGVDALPAALRPAGDVAEVRDVPPVASASNDLFAETALPAVAVVGTSFSRTSNFVPFLARHLGEQVANAAKDGGDFDGAATAYLASAAFRDSAPKVLVWEVPERVLEPPVKASEREWLRVLSAP